MNEEKSLLLSRAIIWIAAEDEPTVMDAREISDFVTVQLVAEVFGIPSIRVAEMVATLRNEL